MENWREIWRNGVAPSLSTAGLKALRKALAKNDPRLLQGETTSPPPENVEWPCAGGCPIAFAAWQGDGLLTVGDIELAFAKTCHAADELLGGPAAVGCFVNYWDESPRKQVVRELLAEVRLELAKRRKHGHHNKGRNQ